VPPKIRDVIRLLEREGWYLDRTRGSHRQFKHPVRPGTVTVAGKPSDDIRPKMWKSVQRQGGLLRRRSDN
jgi:predicted RNA binding protein YcfA (HicA-like mRNA interferase family)